MGEDIIAAVDDDGFLRFWDPCVRTPARTERFASRLRSVASTAAGAIAVGGWDGDITLLNRRSAARQVLARTGAPVWALAFSPDGRHLVAGDLAGNIQVLDASSGQLESKQQYGHGQLYSLAWTNTGDTLAAGGEDGTLELYKVFGGLTTLQRTLPPQGKSLVGLAFSCDSSRLVGGYGQVDDGYNGRVVQWSRPFTNSGSLLGAHRNLLNAIAVDCAGTIAAAGGDNTVSLWRPPAHERLAVLSDADEPLNSIAFSSDGQFLVAAGGAGKHHGVSSSQNVIRFYWLGGVR